MLAESCALLNVRDTEATLQIHLSGDTAVFLDVNTTVVAQHSPVNETEKRAKQVIFYEWLNIFLVYKNISNSSVLSTSVSQALCQILQIVTGLLDNLT